MVDFLRALHFRWVVGEVLVNGESKVEDPAFVHALVRLDGQCEVEDVVRVGEVCAHGRAEGEFRNIWKARYSAEYTTSLLRLGDEAYLFVLVIEQL